MLAQVFGILKVIIWVASTLAFLFAMVGFFRLWRVATKATSPEAARQALSYLLLSALFAMGLLGDVGYGVTLFGH